MGSASTDCLLCDLQGKDPQGATAHASGHAAIVRRPMKDRVFRDPVHGLIEFRDGDRELSRILETRAFQRLRRIKQMGFAWLVYPGAEHSRFGHALGAYQMATRVVAKLALDSNVARHVRIAALVHDIGHGPFSHAWEQVFHGDNHERWGQRLVCENDELREVLEAIEPDLPATISSFWDKSYTPAYARKLVSSQLDVDRLDYLLRDGHYSGAGYATFDLDWILHALDVEKVRDGDDPLDLVIDYRRGRYAVEQYLFARSYMYAQVYHHKTVRAAEWSFIQLMRRFATLARDGDEPAGLAVAGALARDETVPADSYLWLDDISVTTAIDRWAGLGPDGDAGAARDPVLRDLANRLVRRRLFKTIELGDDPLVIDRIRDDVHRAATAQFGDAATSYYALDATRQIGYLPGDSEELHVVGHPLYGTISLGRLLEEQPLGRGRFTVRLLCAPELLAALLPIATAALGT